MQCIPNKRLHSDLSKSWPSNHLYLYSKLIKWYDESIFNFRSVNKNIHMMYHVNFNEKLMLMTSSILKACIIFKSFLKFIYILIKLSFPNAPQFFYSLHPFCYVWQNSCILWRFANIICYVTREIMTQKTFISFRDDGSYNWRGKIPL